MNMQQKHDMDGHHPLSGPLPCLQAREQMIDAQAMLPKMRRPNRPKEREMDRRTDGWMEGQMDGQRDRWTDRQRDR